MMLTSFGRLQTRLRGSELNEMARLIGEEMISNLEVSHSVSTD
jgi:hypothetical protein